VSSISDPEYATRRRQLGFIQLQAASARTDNAPTQPEKRPDGRYRARYRGPDGRERARHFALRRDAERWLAANETAKAKGDWIDPDRGRVMVAEWLPTWFATKATLKPKTRIAYESVVARWVLPQWGAIPLSRITHADVVSWVADMSGRVGPATSGKALLVLTQCVQLAIRDGRLSRDPTVGVRRPRQLRGRQRFLTHGEVEKLAGEMPAPYDLLVTLLAYTGLRFGEVSALQVGSVDLGRSRVVVDRALVELRGTISEGTTKTHRSRTVPVPRVLRGRLADYMDGRDPGEWLFPAQGGSPLRNSNFRHRIFDPAVTRAGLTPLTPHDLRDTAASLAVAAGASVKAVQRMLGHASAAMTLDVYAGPFDDELETWRSRWARRPSPHG
jgi:integrase